MAAFKQFPRLGYVEQKAVASGRKEEVTVILRGWSANKSNQIRFHNQAMLCCRASIREISKRRALWHDRQADAAVPETSAAAPLALLQRLLALQRLLPRQPDEALSGVQGEEFCFASSSSAPFLS